MVGGGGGGGEGGGEQRRGTHQHATITTTTTIKVVVCRKRWWFCKQGRMLFHSVLMFRMFRINVVLNPSYCDIISIPVGQFFGVQFHHAVHYA